MADPAADTAADTAVDTAAMAIRKRSAGEMAIAE